MGLASAHSKALFGKLRLDIVNDIVNDPVSSSTAASKMNICHAVQKALNGALTDPQLCRHLFSGYFRIVSDHLSQTIRRIETWFDSLCGTWVRAK